MHTVGHLLQQVSSQGVLKIRAALLVVLWARLGRVKLASRQMMHVRLSSSQASSFSRCRAILRNSFFCLISLLEAYKAILITPMQLDMDTES